MNEFEKFMDKMSERHIRETSEYDRLQEAFLAGAAAMREKCVEVILQEDAKCPNIPIFLCLCNNRGNRYQNIRTVGTK